MAAMTGGDKLERTLALMGDAAKGSIKAGFLSGSTYPDGTPVAQVAFWFNFGHGGRFPAPPRRFFDDMINNHSSSWAPSLAKALKHYDYDAKMALAATGELMADQLRDSLINLSGPELSPTTLILRKKFWTNPQDIRLSDVLDAQQAVADGEEGAGGTQAKPGIWTGHMLNSIDYEVDQ